MPKSIVHQDRSMRVDSLDSICLRPAKAALPVNTNQSSLRGVVSEAIQHVSTQKAAAIDMAIDPAQLSRQLQTGRITIERLEALGPRYAAELGRLLTEQFGDAAEDPKARAKRKAQELLVELVELVS